MPHERVVPQIGMGYQLLLESAAGEIAGLCENVELVNSMAGYYHIDHEPDASSGQGGEYRNPVLSSTPVADIPSMLLTQNSPS